MTDLAFSTLSGHHQYYYHQLLQRLLYIKGWAGLPSQNHRLNATYNPSLELDHVSPIPPNQCWKISRFFQQKGKNHPIINIVSGGRGELAWCPNFFVRDCSKHGIINYTHSVILTSTWSRTSETSSCAS